MPHNGILVNTGISFGHFITPVVDSMPLIGHAIYLDSAKYHYITIGRGGSQQNITILYHEINEGHLRESSQRIDSPINYITFFNLYDSLYSITMYF